MRIISASTSTENIIISELIFVKLATSDVRSVSYSLGSIILVNVLCILENNDVITVPTNNT